MHINRRYVLKLPLSITVVWHLKCSTHQFVLYIVQILVLYYYFYALGIIIIIIIIIIFRIILTAFCFFRVQFMTLYVYMDNAMYI
jgi:hypothetical protein